MGNAYKNANKEFGASMDADMKKEWWELIDKYLRIIANNKKNNSLPNVIACEKNFNFELEENLILNGMIDRIQIDADNVLHVADYKTTKNKKYLKNDFFQLLTYAYALLLGTGFLKQVPGYIGPLIPMILESATSLREQTQG